jgi:hypothetical protein
VETAADRRPTITLRDAAAIIHAVGFALVGASRLARELRQHQHERPRNRSRRCFLQERNAPTMTTITLYRPVGLKERDLIAQSGYQAFPPRLPHQPIFYPVLNEPYATQIARDWNTKDAFSGYVGYVTRFQVRAEFLAHYEVKTVGASEHQEYWIPAEDLPALNACIVGEIEVIATYRRESAS